ncbi:hypothetical protein [Mesobacillus subterraneus]|uniref:hypothetical protein n=1 Tax=Mesobacillus subterraneus TaxID=285983 RepID=UPI001CFC56EB|nr:hypothetical protein [Mesobacillus subterraneus]
MSKMIINSIIAIAMILSLVVVGGPQQKAQAATTSADALVTVGQMGADSYSQTLNGVLHTVDQIGFMADRIL